MSLYDLAVTPGQKSEPLVVIKHSATAADDDPQNTIVHGGQTGSIIITPQSGEFADPAAPQPPAVVVNTQPAEIKTAITKLARFIPTESITIYLAAVSTVAAIDEANKASTNGATDAWITNLFHPKTLYWTTAMIITPVIFLLIRAIAQMKLNKKPFAEFPFWKLSASIVAFLLWALAIPNNPYADTAAAKAAFAFLAIIISIFLDLIDQFYEEKKAKAASGAV